MAAPRYPNRTGEIGTLSAGVVTLSGQPLPGMRTFADALAATRIADGDTVGVAIRATSDGNKWTVWRGVYDATAGTIEPDLVEDTSAAAIPTDALVEVVACVTDSILRNLTYVEPEYDYGPANWTPDDSEHIAWLPMDGLWRPTLEYGTNAQLNPVTAIAELRPTTWSIDVYVPPGADMVEAESAGFVLYYPGGYLEVYAGATVTEGWNTVSGTVTDQTGDIIFMLLFWGPADMAGYRFRNFVADAP